MFDQQLLTSAVAQATFSPRVWIDSPSLLSPDPAQGPPGTFVRLPYRNLDANNISNYSVTLGSAAVPLIAEAAPPPAARSNRELILQFPPDAQSGRFQVRTTNLVLESTLPFTVMPGFVIEPEFVEVLAGGTNLFTLRGIDPFVNPVEWQVDDIAGGNAEVGTIDSAGVYTAPAGLTENRRVVVSAWLLSDTNITGSAVVDLTPFRPSPGAATISALAGGQVVSREGGASVDIPPNALTGDTSITINELPTADWPAPNAGEELLGVAELGPDGLNFNQPVTVTFPLRCACPPGAQLALMAYDPIAGMFVDEGFAATVDETGTSASGQVTHFSLLGVSTQTRATGMPAPGPTLEAAVLPEEGRDVPVRITGSGLDPNLTVEVYDPQTGLPASGFSVLSWVGRTNVGGYVIRIPVIRDLSDGSLRSYNLRLIASTGHRDVAFNVHGLDEFHLGAGQYQELHPGTARRWSEVVIESNAVLRVLSGALDWQVTGPVIIDYGDAPDAGGPGPNYPTTQDSNGARHIVRQTGPRLGKLIDADSGELQNFLATADDED